MKLTCTGGYGELCSQLAIAERQIPVDAQIWAERCARSLDRFYRYYLSRQGRGGAPPPLSDLTRRIYDVDGEPSGDGIRNHIEINVTATAHHAIAVWGIPEGKPAMVARVQDGGATIRVTQKMRGYMAARYGIFLKQSTQVIVIPARHSWRESKKFAAQESRSQLSIILRSLRP